MLSIFICEDDDAYLTMLAACVKEYVMFSELDMELALSTTDHTDMLRVIEDNKVHGLYILDVELQREGNGVEVAKTIRQHDPRGFIVFVTAHDKYLSLTFKYQVEALDYIQKASGQNAVCRQLCECLQNAYRKHVSRPESGRFIFKLKNGCKASCEYADILFFETGHPMAPRKIVLHAKKKPYIFYGSLDKLMAELPKGSFFRCHRSFVLNVDNLSEICKEDLNQGKETLIMPNGAECAVAARKRKDLLRLM